MVAQEGEYTWDLSLFGHKYPLNLTQTKAPSLETDSNLLKMNFEGLFHVDGKPQDNKFMYHGFFPNISHTHRE